MKEAAAAATAAAAAAMQAVAKAAASSQKPASIQAMQGLFERAHVIQQLKLHMFMMSCEQYAVVENQH